MPSIRITLVFDREGQRVDAALQREFGVTSVVIASPGSVGPDDGHVRVDPGLVREALTRQREIIKQRLQRYGIEIIDRD